MHSDPLQQPVGALMHPIELLSATDSLQRAATAIRHSRGGCCPFIEGGRVVGIVTDTTLAAALSRGASADDSCGAAVQSTVSVLPVHATGAQALRSLTETGTSSVIVVDGSYPVGIVGAADLFPGTNPDPTPPFIGGMATPFGVYLTTGNLGAGARPVALAATGFLMFAIFLASTLATYTVTASMAPGTAVNRLSEALPILFFLIGLRVLPLSGIHAAEHKVVHAIERGEPLTLQAVKRMPRVHPRCGTNLATGASVFMAIASSEIIKEQEPRLLIALVVTLFAWRPLGNALQLLITTRPPTDRQVAGAIRSAEDLLKKYRTSRGKPASVLDRIWYSGLPHVMVGSTLAYCVVWLLSEAFGLNLPV